ncbi:transcription activator of gluconeogenesis ert1 [Fusarium langsethiae]|uniref:Transcription activator of gluconeogenesis ert1 n=1 Tax=Fusarium langsethiae TaxID=179993 RepID=A0A0N0V5T4_FUSLA|nr:transcription activator of gluconeogenesis ert1 [Fusarium langsethiae]
MLTKGPLLDTTSAPLGQRRGISDLAQIALDLTWASESAKNNTIARYRAYPSPPMSGSPPLPPRQPHDSGDRRQPPAGYSTPNQPDSYWSNLSQQPNDNRGPPSMQTTLPRLFQQGPPDHSPFPYRRPDDPASRHVSYIQSVAPPMSQQAGYIPPTVPRVSSPYASSARPSIVENQPMTSPKSQRKTKGHVASACVPCKRAHLRCDEASAYPPPLLSGPRGADPVAFLNMKMDFAKASPAFMEAVGQAELQGQNLVDVVVLTEREKVASIRSQLIEEQTRKEPNYLPPILGRLDRILQGLGFGAEEIGRFQLDRHEYLTFRAADGQPRQYPIRLGLAKEGTIYFIVMVLSVPIRHTYPLPSSPAAREAAHSYISQPPTPQSVYRTPAPPTTPFDMTRGPFNEVPLVSRPAAGPSTQLPTSANHGIAVGAVAASYAASPGRMEYGPPQSYNVPRSELPPSSAYRPQATFQLPPIRAQPEQSGSRPTGDQKWPHEDRPTRVDIGGLIDKPENPAQPR